MRLTLRYSIYFLLMLLKYSETVPVPTVSKFVENLRVRVRRQDGYVYDKPNVSFDLPERSTTAPTQAPTVDRTLTQQMYYAYPAPSGGNGDVINIGNTAGTTTTVATFAPSAAAGYNYRSSTTGNSGYNYGTASTGAQANTGYQVTNSGSQTTVTDTQTNTGSSQASSGSGYGNNAPSPTLSPTLQGVSTTAPKYLPPTGGGSVSSGGAGVSVTSTSGQVTTDSSTSVQTSSVGTLSDTYLPPLGSSNTATSGQISVSTNAQTNTGGLVAVPSTAYLPPNQLSPSAPAPSPGPPSSQPAPPAGYIPPSGPSPGPVSTPASAYLPPSFF